MFLIHRRHVLRGSVHVFCLLLQYLLPTGLCSTTLDSGTPMLKIGFSSEEHEQATTIFQTTLNAGLVVELGNRTEQKDAMPWDVTEVRQEPRDALTDRQDSLNTRLPLHGRPSYATTDTDDGSTRVDGRVTSTFIQQNDTNVSLVTGAPLDTDLDVTVDSPNIGDKGKEVDTSTESHDTDVSMEVERSKVAEKEQPDIKVIREQLDTTVAVEQLDTTVARQQLDTTVARQQLDTTVARQQLDTALGRQQLNTTVGKQQLDTTVARQQLDTTVARQQLDTTVARQQLDTTVTRQQLDTTVARQQLDTTVTKQQLDTTVAEEEAVPGSAARLYAATQQQSLNKRFPGPPEPVLNNTGTRGKISEEDICDTEDCGLEVNSRSEGKQSGTQTSAAWSDESLVGNNPTVSIRVLMPPTDNHFFLSSSTLQDLWQNHINAAAAVPMEIVETSASDLMEYYLPLPDPGFVVPVMASRSPGSLVVPSLTAPTTLVTDPALQRPQQAAPSPTATVTLGPLADPSNTVVQVLPQPPVSTVPSRILYRSPVPSVYRTPSNMSEGETSQTSVDGVSTQTRFPGLTNPSDLPVMLPDMTSKFPPQFVLRGLGGVPAPASEAVTEDPLGLRRQGTGHKILIPNTGGHIRFPGTPQNPGKARPSGPDGSTVRATPHPERPESGDTRLLIRIKASDAVAATQPGVSSQGNDRGYSEIDLGDGQTIGIRVKGSPGVASSTKHSHTSTQHHSSQTLPPQNLPRQPRPTLSLQPQTQPPKALQPQSRPSQRLPLPRKRPHQHLPQPIRQAVTPSSTVTRLPVGQHPADDRLSTSDPPAPSRSDLGNRNNQFNEGGIRDTMDYYSTEGISSTGSLANKGGSGVFTGLFNKDSLGGIKGQLNKGLGNLQNLFSKEGLRGIRGQFNKGVKRLEDLLNKGGLRQLQNGDISSQITSGVDQVNYKLQKLVDPLQTKVESSFTTAVNFLKMFFGHVLPTDYYDKILTVLAIIAFLAFVHVRISLMVTSLAQTPLTLSFFQKTSEFFKILKESDQLQVMYELAKDVHDSIEHWTEAQLGLPTSFKSKIPFVSSLSHFFGSSDAEEASVSPDSIFSHKTLFVPDTNTSDILPHATSRISNRDMFELPSTPETAPNTTGVLLGEVEELARLGASLVDLTLEHGRHRWPPSGASCLQRPVCDLNTYSSTRGGLSGFVFPFLSTGAVWLARPPDDVFTFLDTFRPLWLAGSRAPGTGCLHIHTCGSHASPVH